MMLLFLMALPPLEAQAGDGEITGIAEAVDGGTLRIVGVNLPLWGIDVPAPDTPEGLVARLFIRLIISEGPMTCHRKTKERWLCLTDQGSDIASLLVQTGQARATDPYYAHEEMVARRSRRGMWRSSDW